MMEVAARQKTLDHWQLQVIGRVYVSARDKMKQGGIHRIRRSRQCTDAAEAEVRCGF